VHAGVRRRGIGAGLDDRQPGDVGSAGLLCRGSTAASAAHVFVNIRVCYDRALFSWGGDTRCSPQSRSQSVRWISCF
jgi:hypothetical protein